MNRYDYLSLVAMIAVPLAPAFFFGHRVYTAVIALGAPSWLAVLIGFTAAVGLELVGILAGHVANTAWQVSDYGRAVLGALIMAVYVVIGVVELRGSIGAVMFLIAPLVYLLAALQEGLHTTVNQNAADTAVQQAFDLEQEARENDHRRQMETQQAERAAANDLQIALAHEQALAAVEIAQAKTRASIANAEARMVLAQAKSEPAVKQLEPAPASYVCEDCGQPFATVQALNAHGRKHRVPVNGVAS